MDKEKGEEDNYTATKKSEYESQSIKLNAERRKLKAEIDALTKKTSSVKAPTETPMEVIKKIKEQIGITALKLNSQKEKNKRDEKCVKELKELLESLKENIEYSDTKFSKECLSLFDKCFYSTDNSTKFWANDVYKAITKLLKDVEKKYDFNAIDPIDEERDHADLKFKLMSYEKHKEQLGPVFMREDTLSQSDKNKIDALDEIKDLNELKRLEDRVFKLLKHKDPSVENHAQVLNDATLDVSDSYYKKSIMKARGKMIDKKQELVDKESELNWKQKEVYTDKINKLEDALKHT